MNESAALLSRLEANALVQNCPDSVSTAVLYPTDVAVQRLATAMAARQDPQFVIMARTDAYHTDPERGYDVAIERARAYASVGADIVFVLGLPRERVTTQLTSTLGAPLLHAEVGAVSAHDRDQVFASGASLFHGLLPILAAYSAYKETVLSLKEGTQPAFDRDAWAVNRELLETMDLRGWSQSLSDPRRAGGTTT